MYSTYERSVVRVYMWSVHARCVNKQLSFCGGGYYANSSCTVIFPTLYNHAKFWRNCLTSARAKELLKGRMDDSLMLATICVDTWNVLNMHQIAPKSKRWDYLEIPGGGAWKDERICPHCWRRQPQPTNDEKTWPCRITITVIVTSTYRWLSARLQ